MRRPIVSVVLRALATKKSPDHRITSDSHLWWLSDFILWNTPNSLAQVLLDKMIHKWFNITQTGIVVSPRFYPLKFYPTKKNDITFFNPFPRPLRPALPKYPMWSLAVSFWRHGRNRQKIDRSCQRSPQGPIRSPMGLGPSFVVSFTAPTVGKVRELVIPFQQKKHRKVSLKNVTPKENFGKLYRLPKPISQVCLCDFFFNKSQVDALKYISWKEVIPRKAVFQLPARGHVFCVWWLHTPWK